MAHVRHISILLGRLGKVGFFFLALYSTAYGQENIQFFVNPYAFNPSYAGGEGRPSFYLNYRRQWINVDGSPQTGSLSFHTPLKKFVSVGVNLTNDKRGLFKTNSLLVSGAYTILLGDFKSLRFGLSAGASSTKLDLTELDDSQDPALATGGNTYMQGNAGLSVHLKTFHAGIALPAIFEPSHMSGVPSTLDPLQSVVFHASNRFYFLRNKHVLEPHLLYRYRGDRPSQLEAAIVYQLDHVVWFGGSYKQDFGNSAFAGLHLNKAFGLGYSYTFKTASGNELNSPSHEIQLTLLLGHKRKDLPFYSFVDTDKEKKIHQQKYQSASAVIAQNRQNKPSAPAKDKPVTRENHQARLPENVTKKQTLPSQKNNTEPQKVSPHTKTVGQPIQKKLGQMPHVHDTLHPAHDEEKERIARLEVHADNPAEHHGDDPSAHPHAERHEFVKQGGHSEELEIGDYVIAGVFRSKINAEHFADGLRSHGFKAADQGHLTERNLWYVYLAHTSDLDQAKAERDKYRKMKIFRDAWLLTVHH